MSATSLKVHYEPQFGICIFMNRTRSQVVFSCMCTAHCLTVTRVMSWVRRTTTLSFPYRILLIFVFAACESIVTGNPHMGNESTFLPALLDAFKNQSSYARKVVNPLPLCSTDFFCSTDVVFDKALSF
jgi:hypothetical protein